jgi:glycosyltransferase involved in cell wall biosynthesis
MRKKKIFLGGYINYLNAQNINCKSIATHLDKDKFEIFTMKLSDANNELIDGVSMFNCLKPYRISIPLAMVRGLLKCDIAYFPKHLDTPNWILKFANFLRKPVFTTIEITMCDRSKTNLIDNFGGITQLKNHFDLIPNIYGISQFITDNAKCGVHLNQKILSLGVESKLYESKVKNKLTNIVFVGSLIKRKNVSQIIDLGAKFPDLNFHVIGDGNLLNILNEDAPENIKFYGKLNPLELSEVLQSMDALFLPSRSEGFPKVILEAAASGIPSIVYSDYGASEWINNGKNGFVVNEFKEVIEVVNRLLDEGDLLQSCSSEVVYLADEFSWKNKIKVWEEEINNILNA